MLRKQSKNTSIKLYQQGSSSNNHHGTKFQFFQQPGAVNHLRVCVSNVSLSQYLKRYTNVETSTSNGHLSIALLCPGSGTEEGSTVRRRRRRKASTHHSSVTLDVTRQHVAVQGDGAAVNAGWTPALLSTALAASRLRFEDVDTVKKRNCQGMTMTMKIKKNIKRNGTELILGNKKNQY